MGLLFFIFKIYCRIHVSAFWEKWRIGVSRTGIRIRVSVQHSILVSDYQDVSNYMHPNYFM